MFREDCQSLIFKFWQILLLILLFYMWWKIYSTSRLLENLTKSVTWGEGFWNPSFLRCHLEKAQTCNFFNKIHWLHCPKKVLIARWFLSDINSIIAVNINFPNFFFKKNFSDTFFHLLFIEREIHQRFIHIFLISNWLMYFLFIFLFFYP